MKNIDYLEIWMAVLIGITINLCMLKSPANSDDNIFITLFAPICFGIVLTIIKLVCEIRLKKHKDS